MMAADINKKFRDTVHEIILYHPFTRNGTSIALSN